MPGPVSQPGSLRIGDGQVAEAQWAKINCVFVHGVRGYSIAIIHNGNGALACKIDNEKQEVFAKELVSTYYKNSDNQCFLFNYESASLLLLYDRRLADKGKKIINTMKDAGFVGSCDQQENAASGDVYWFQYVNGSFQSGFANIQVAR